nr:hypothetical protein [Tanacetum cinerariifolium]
MCELASQIVQKKQEEKRIEEEQAANARYWKIPAYWDDDDDYNFVIIPILSTKEPIDSLKKQKEKRIEKEQAAKARYWKILACCDDDDDYNSAIRPVLSTEEPVNSLKFMLNHDSSIISFSLKIESLLDEFTGELTLLKSISPGVDKTDCH